MHTSFVLAAAFASVVAAQSSAAGPSPTSAPSTGDKPNAFMIPEGGSLGPFEAGKAITVSWALNGADASGAVTIKPVWGPSSALTTGSAVFTADSNKGSATFTIPAKDVPAEITSVALAISEEGEADNYSGQVGFSGGEAEAGSSSGSSAEASATETGAASTLETAASTGAEPTATDSFSGNSTVTGGANTAIETKSSSLPTETQSAVPSASATGSGASSVAQVSFAALFAGLVATVFAL